MHLLCKGLSNIFPPQEIFTQFWRLMDLSTQDLPVQRENDVIEETTIVYNAFQQNTG